MFIEAQKYRNAVDTTKGGWAVTDKIFEYLDKAGDIYNEVRYPRPGDPGYDALAAQKRREEAGIFGLPKPFGVLLLIGGVSLLALGMYQIAK